MPEYHDHNLIQIKPLKKSYSQMCIQHTCNIIEEANVDSFILHMIFNPF